MKILIVALALIASAASTSTVFAQCRPGDPKCVSTPTRTCVCP